jgi:hypothetical protein
MANNSMNSSEALRSPRTDSLSKGKSTKGIKLSKASWLILLAGVFVVILAGLGMTRSQQARELGRINEELSLSETRLDKLDVTSLKQQLNDLNRQVEAGRTQLEDAREKLRQTVVSVDVTDEFFKIAADSGVTVMNLTTSTISEGKLEGIGLKTISLSAQAKGDLEKIVDFIINLNDGYATGYVQSAQISIQPDESGQTGAIEGDGDIEAAGGEAAGPAEDGTTVAVQMIIYSYEGD